MSLSGSSPESPQRRRSCRSHDSLPFSFRQAFQASSPQVLPLFTTHSGSPVARLLPRYPTVPIPKISSTGWAHKSHSQKRHCNAITKGVVFTLCLIFSFYGLKVLIFCLDLTNLVEDQKCPVKQWSYPTCRYPGANITQTIPTPSDWLEIRQAYHKAVRSDHFSLERSTWINGSATGFHVPVEARYQHGLGRGLFATTDIPEGTKVADNRYSARIQSACEARKFLQELTNDQACNVIMWAYTFDFGSGQLEWSIDLDIASFTNEANTRVDVNIEDRVDVPSKATQPRGWSTWTTRDILAGEELLLSYDDLREFSMKKNLFWHVKLVVRSWGFIFLY